MSWTLSLLFLLGAALSGGISWLIVSYFRGSPKSEVGLDLPIEARKHHETPTPRVGGLALCLAFAVAATLIVDLHPPLLVGALLIFLLGLGDDLFTLNSYKKLAGQILIAAITFGLGLRIEAIPLWGGELWVLPLAASFALTILWLVMLPNVMNLIDGMDGLAAGIALIAMLALALAGIQVEITLIMAGALVAFLGFNFPRARLFLGDGGAYLLGFLFAGWAILDLNQTHSAGAVALTISLLAIPILDSAFAFARRLWTGKNVMRGDAEHIHHRLLARGHSPVRAVFTLYGATFFAAALGLIGLRYEHAVLFSAASLILVGLRLWWKLSASTPSVDPPPAGYRSN